MCVYLYIASSPFIAINTLHLSQQVYGAIGLIPFIGTGLGSLISAWLSMRFSVKALMLAGFIIEIAAMITLSVLFYFGIINLVALIGCGFIQMFGNCIIVGNGASIATSTSEDKANASAMMNFINVGMLVVGTFLLAISPGTPIIKLPIGFLLGISVMCLVWFIFIQPRKENRP